MTSPRRRSARRIYLQQIRREQSQSEVDWNDFDRLSSQSPRLAYHSRTSLLSLTENPQQFILQYGHKFHSSPPVAIAVFKQLYKDHNGKAIRDAQQDPHEFLTVLLETLTMFYHVHGFPNITRKLFWINIAETYCSLNTITYRKDLFIESFK